MVVLWWFDGFLWDVSSGNLTKLLNIEKEIVDFPIENGGSFQSCVNVYQRVDP